MKLWKEVVHAVFVVGCLTGVLMVMLWMCTRM